MASFDLKVHGDIAYELRGQSTVGSGGGQCLGLTSRLQPWHVQAEERLFQSQRTVDQLSVARGPTTYHMVLALVADTVQPSEIAGDQHLWLCNACIKIILQMLVTHLLLSHIYDPRSSAILVSVGVSGVTVRWVALWWWWAGIVGALWNET